MSVMFNKGDEVFIKTESEALRISALSEFGAEVYYSDDEVLCYETSTANNSKYYGPITSFHHAAVKHNFETLFVKGRLSEGCLTLSDKRGEPYLAVFPSRLDSGLLYNLLQESDYRDSPETRIIWLDTPLTLPAEGVKVDLSEPVTKCGGVSKAILLRDTPIWDWDGFAFPSP